MSNKKTSWKIILILSIIVFLIAAIMLIIHVFPKVNDVVLPPSQTSPTSQAPSIELVENPINFEEQYAINDEIVAWISVPKANVNYPILQSYTSNENFYLDHNVEKKKNAKGAIYIQKGNNKDFSDSVTVVYGHNMKNGTMFGSLRRFRNSEFFNENRKMYIYTPGHILTYEIYGAFVYDNRHILNSFNFDLKEDLEDFISQTLNPKSMTKNILENAKVNTNDKIVVLSTCTGIKTERYLVVGVLIDDQPTY